MLVVCNLGSGSKQVYLPVNGYVVYPDKTFTPKYSLPEMNFAQRPILMADLKAILCTEDGRIAMGIEANSQHMGRTVTKVSKLR